MIEPSTVELKELIDTIPAMENNDWVMNSEKEEVLLRDFVDAIIDGHIPAVHGIGFLTDSALSMPELALLLSEAVVNYKPPEGELSKSLGAIVIKNITIGQGNLDASALITESIHAEEYWKSQQPFSTEAAIQYYLVKAYQNLQLSEYFEQLVDIIVEDDHHDSNPIFALAERNAKIEFASCLKMALYRDCRDYGSRYMDVLRNFRDYLDNLDGTALSELI